MHVCLVAVTILEQISHTKVLKFIKNNLPHNEKGLKKINILNLHHFNNTTYFF